MADPAYIAKHGIKTVRVPLTEIHGEIRKPEYVVEYEDIIIETNTMPTKDWIKCAVYSWIIQLKYVFGVDISNNMSVLDRWFTSIAKRITEGKSRAMVDIKFGNIYWEPEEFTYLLLCEEMGLITGDPKEFAREHVLFGRKSKVRKKDVLA